MANKNEKPAPSAAELLKRGSQGGENGLMGSIGTAPAGEPAPAEPQSAIDVRMADMQQQIAVLTRIIQNGGSAADLEDVPKPRQYTARVAFWEGQYPIVTFGQAKTKIVDKEEQITIPIGILKDGAIEQVVAEYVPLMNDVPRYLATIVKQTKDSKKTHQGPVATKHIARPSDPLKISEDSRTFQPREITLDHRYDVIACTVKFLEGPMKGEELSLSADALNK